MRGLLLGTLVIIGGACAYGAYVYANKPKHQYASRSSAKSAGQTWAGIGSWFSGSSRDQGPSSFLDGQCKAAAFGTAFAAFTGKKPTKSAAEVERECRQIGRDVETAFSEMNRQLSSRPWRN